MPYKLTAILVCRAVYPRCLLYIVFVRLDFIVTIKQQVGWCRSRVCALHLKPFQESRLFIYGLRFIPASVELAFNAPVRCGVVSLVVSTANCHPAELYASPLRLTCISIQVHVFIMYVFRFWYREIENVLVFSQADTEIQAELLHAGINSVAIIGC